MKCEECGGTGYPKREYPTRIGTPPDCLQCSQNEYSFRHSSSFLLTNAVLSAINASLCSHASSYVISPSGTAPSFLTISITSTGSRLLIDLSISSVGLTALWAPCSSSSWNNSGGMSPLVALPSLPKTASAHQLNCCGGTLAV